MPKTSVLLRAGMAIAILVFLQACATTRPESTTRLAGTTEVPRTPSASTERKLLRVGEQLPWFGGMFFDEKGDLNVYIVDDIRILTPQAVQERAGAAQKAIGAVFGEQFLQRRGRTTDKREELPRAPDIRLVQGRYTVRQLAEWRSTAAGILELPGVVFTDLDEARNRLKIGVESAAPRARIETELKKLGIPPEAVIIEETRPIRFHATLRSKFRPMRGGIQVESDTGIFSYGICTAGFNATRAGVSGFVTNSHCTKNRGGSEGTDFHQPDDPWWTEGNKVGDEIADPPYFTGGPCPSGRRCRLSDSAFVDYTIPRGQDIARTTGWNNASLEVNASKPILRIVSEISSWVNGNELDKIGRTTGWTYGVVSGTCQDINVADTDVTLLCQDTVTRRPTHTHTMSDNGDSGSPVFRWLGDDAELAGILWGGTDDGTLFAFSPLDQVEQELGALTTFAFPSPSPTTPTQCPVGRRCCEWDVDPKGKPFCLICVPYAAECP